MQHSDANHSVFYLRNLWDRGAQEVHTNITFMLKVIKAGNE